MTHEEIIKAWFAIDELGGENVCTELHSYHTYDGRSKMYTATILFCLGNRFMSQDADRYKAMESAINKYSEWVIQNESKQ